MSDPQDNSSTSAPPPAKKFRYEQGQLKGTEKLFTKSKFPDVHFSFDSNDGTIVRVPAHKCLLAGDSDVFEAMFYGDLKENGDITITDASAAVFKEFLQFFYLSEVKLSAEHIAEVMYLGNKYNVEKCIDGCVKLLQDDLSNENVCNTLSLAILYNQAELLESCMKRILMYTTDVFASNGFLDSAKAVLVYILRMNLLSCSEVEVFEACMAWVRAKSKQSVVTKALVKRYLGDSYYQIRFASMTIQEFCALETKYGAVLSSDFKTIMRLIAKPEKETEQFNAHPRQIKWKNDSADIWFHRDIFSTQHQWYGLDNEEKTIFSTNQVLVLDRFFCNRIKFDKTQVLRSNLSVEVEVTEARTLDDANVKVLSNMTAILGSPWTVVSLPQPILIRPDFFYTIHIKGFPQGHYFDSDAQESSVTHCSGLEIKFHSDKIVNGNIVNVIYYLGFNKITQKNIID